MFGLADVADRFALSVSDGRLDVVRSHERLTVIGEADDVPQRVVIVRGERRLARARLPFVEPLVGADHLGEDRRGRAAGVRGHSAGRDVTELVAVLGLGERPPLPVLHGLSLREPLPVVAVVQELAHHRAVQELVRRQVAVLLGHPAEAVEVALEAVVEAVLVLVGGELGVGAVADHAVEHGDAAEDEARLRHVVGVADPRVVKIEARAQRTFDRLQHIGAPDRVQHHRHRAVLGGEHAVDKAVAVQVRIGDRRLRGGLAGVDADGERDGHDPEDGEAERVLEASRGAAGGAIGDGRSAGGLAPQILVGGECARPVDRADEARAGVEEDREPSG